MSLLVNLHKYLEIVNFLKKYLQLSAKLKRFLTMLLDQKPTMQILRSADVVVLMMFLMVEKFVVTVD